MAKTKPITWMDEPEEHDYPASVSYLTLHYEEKKAIEITNKLKTAPLVEFKAKDIYRASALPLLGISNLHVKRNLKKIKHGEALSPLLLVRDTKTGKLLISDGYHRMCAVYTLDEDAFITCKIV